jgi:hypothetical protein
VDADLLQEHLREEVVALVVHPSDNPPQRLRRHLGEERGARAGDGRARRAVGADAGAVERPHESLRGGQRGRGRFGTLYREGCERRAFGVEETALPAVRPALRVEQRIVRQHAAVEPADPGRPNPLRERRKVPPVEGRVARAAQDDVSAPHAVDEAAAAEHLGRVTEAGPKLEKRRHRDRQLLVRGGRERQVTVARVHRLARGEVDDDGAASRRRRAACPQRAIEAGCQRPAGAACDSRQPQDADEDDENDDGVEAGRGRPRRGRR